MSVSVIPRVFRLFMPESDMSSSEATSITVRPAWSKSFLAKNVAL